jgi:hypothetical protein
MWMDAWCESFAVPPLKIVQFLLYDIASAGCLRRYAPTPTRRFDRRLWLRLRCAKSWREIFQNKSPDFRRSFVVPLSEQQYEQSPSISWHQERGIHSDR